MKTGARPIVPLAAILLLSCDRGSIGVPDGGADRGPAPIDPRAAVCAAPDAAPGPVSYPQIEQIFDENCTSCHAVGAALDLSDQVSWANLVNQPAPAPESCGGFLVTPGDPDNSFLYQKLSSATPCSGSQMPRGEFYPAPLPPCVVAMVRRWILEGAPGVTTDGGTG